MRTQAYDLIQQNSQKGHAELADCKAVVDMLLKKGVPADKVVLGIPAYVAHTSMPR